jgi:hypothetical protein
MLGLHYARAFVITNTQVVSATLQHRRLLSYE